MRSALVLLVALATPVFAQGTVTVADGAATLANGAHLETAGSLGIASGATLDASAGTLAFVGDAAQSLAVGGSPLVVQTLEIDKSGGVLTVADSVRVTRLLDLIGGDYDFAPEVVVLRATVNGGDVQSLSAQRTTGAVRAGAPPVYERPHLDGAGWRMIAAPLAAAFTSLNDDFHTQGAVGADVEGGAPNVYLWDPTRPDGDRYVGVTDFAPGMEAGRGYFLYAYDAVGSTTGLLPTVWDVAGDEHAGPVTVPLSYDAGDAEAGAHLLGNPYAAPLDWASVQASAALQAAYAVWDPGANGGLGNYAFHSTAGVSTGEANGVIAPAQGFWAETSAASPASLTFDAGWRAFGASPVFVGRSGQPSHLRVRLTGQGLEATEPVALFLDGGDVGPDLYDASWIAPASSDYVAAAFVREGADWLVFEGRSAEADGQSLDLAVRSTRPGAYTLAWPTLDLAPPGPITLTDRETGAVVDLRSQPSYAFDISELTAAAPGPSPAAPVARRSGEPARFSVTFGALVDAAQTDDALELRVSASPNPSAGSTVIAFALPAAGSVRVDVVDMTGRVVARLADGEHAAGSHRLRLDTARLSSGVYAVRVAGEGALVTTRLTVAR